VRRQHHVAVLAALALFHADQHALAVDVGELERDHLGGAQSRPIGHAQRRLVFEPWRGIEQPRDLFRAEHHRQLPRLANEMGVLDDIVALEGDPEKEPQCRDRLVEGCDPNTTATTCSW
jgi:hypothetical protein